MATDLDVAITPKEEESDKQKTLQVLKFIINYQQADRGKVPQNKILDKFENLNCEDLSGLESIGYISNKSIKGMKYWTLESRGHEFLRNETLTNELKKSRQQQKRSSATETIFTIVLLLGSAVQVTNIIFDKLTGTNRLLSIGILSTVIITVVGFSLKVGWPSLKEVGKQVIFKTDGIK